MERETVVVLVSCHSVDVDSSDLHWRGLGEGRKIPHFIGQNVYEIMM